MSGRYALSLSHVSKSYRLMGRRSQFQTLKSALLRRELVRGEVPVIEALRDVSFDLERGEAFGIVGRNGSGKSTLLKIISGILKPSSGSVIVDGRVSALIELGAGFHPEITGRENVYINGIMLGLSRKQIDEKFDRIVEFAGVGEYLDQPVKTYSSGMYVRLGFAVAVNVEPDILLIDEVLSVGDEEFSQKCVAKIQEMKYRGVTMLFVTHQLDLVRHLCDRALWLDAGRAEAIGEPLRVLDEYLQSISGEKHQETPEPEPGDGEDAAEGTREEEERWGSGEAMLSRVALADRNGQELVAIGGGSPVVIELSVRVRKPLTDFVFGLGLFHADGTCVFGTNTDIEGFAALSLESDGMVRFVVPAFDLVAGTYRLDAAIHTRNGRAIDYRRGAIRFVVGSKVHDTGVYRPPHHWEFEGGISFREIDLRERNVPAPMAEFLRESDEEQKGASGPGPGRKKPSI